MIAIATLAGILLTQILLSTGYIAYSIWVGDTHPLHALLVFNFVTTLTICVLRPTDILKIFSIKSYRTIAAVLGVCYCVYFMCLLTSIGIAGPSIATLVLSAEICTTGIIGIYAKHKKFHRPLILFTIAIFIIIYLIKTDGRPTLDALDKSFLLLLMTLISGAALAYIRVVWIVNHQAPDSIRSALPMAGIAFSLIPTIICICLAAPFLGSSQFLKSLISYNWQVYAALAYIGFVPNIVMLTMAITFERKNPVLFHSLSSTKFLAASAISLLPFFDSQQENLLSHPSPFRILAIILYLLLIYLYNHLDSITNRLNLTK